MSPFSISDLRFAIDRAFRGARQVRGADEQNAIGRQLSLTRVLAGLGQRWLARLTGFQGAYALWFGKRCVVVAWMGLALALVSAPEGLGIPLCFFHETTGVPCPGCGLTRSLSCAIRGLFDQSWHYHPMGLLVLTVFILIAIQRMLPGTLRLKLAKRMNAQGALFGGLYVLFVTTFVGFGAIRAVWAIGMK